MCIWKSWCGEGRRYKSSTSRIRWYGHRTWIRAEGNDGGNLAILLLLSPENLKLFIFIIYWRLMYCWCRVFVWNGRPSEMKACLLRSILLIYMDNIGGLGGWFVWISCVHARVHANDTMADWGEGWDRRLFRGSTQRVGTERETECTGVVVICCVDFLWGVSRAFVCCVLRWLLWICSLVSWCRF